MRIEAEEKVSVFPIEAEEKKVCAFSRQRKRGDGDEKQVCY